MKRPIRIINSKTLCSRCREYKSQDEFCKSCFKNKHYICNSCLKLYRKSRLGNINRVIDNIYYHQVNSDKVSYTWEQFSKWLITSTSFLQRFKFWQQCEYNKDLIPAVVRGNAQKSYSFDNLIVTTAKDARLLNIRKRQRVVVQLSVNNEEIARFPNAYVAAKLLNIKCFANIHECCKGRRLICKGYKWRYL